MGKGGKFALVSGDEANNREKAREVYCPQPAGLLLRV